MSCDCNESVCDQFDRMNLSAKDNKVVPVALVCGEIALDAGDISIDVCDTNYAMTPICYEIAGIVYHGFNKVGINCDTGVIVSNLILDLAGFVVTGAIIVECDDATCCYTRTICLCDDVNGDASVIVPFERLLSVNTVTGDVTIIGDYVDDLQTPYVVQGTAGECCDIGEEVETPTYTFTTTTTLCDTVGTNVIEFVRISGFNDVTQSLELIGDYTADFSGEYSTMGIVGSCDSALINAQELAYTQGRYELSGVGTYNRSNNVQALTLLVRSVGDENTPPTITDNNGSITRLYVGDNETWSAPSGTLTGNFSISHNNGDVITIILTELS